MRNLKRALSLALASIMLLGMMVVGAGAKGLDDFSDAAEITNKDAVAITSAIGIFDGYETGDFRPERVVTRGEMAVIISKILLGAKVDVSQFTGQNTFTDVPAWAEGYVNLCASLGIVAGYGDGKFGTNDTVTTAQAALMLTRALGYFQNESELGDSWSLAATAKAQALGIYSGLTGLAANAGLNRDNVAGMVFNTITKASTVEYNASFNMYYTTGTEWASGVRFNYLETLGYKNFHLVYKDADTDDFNRPSTIWGTGLVNGSSTATNTQASGVDVDGNLINSRVTIADRDIILVTDNDVAAEWTGKVSQKAMYEAAGSDVVKNYSWEVYVNGLDITPGSLRSGNSSDSRSWTFDATTMSRTASADFAKAFLQSEEVMKDKDSGETNGNAKEKELELESGAAIKDTFYDTDFQWATTNKRTPGTGTFNSGAKDITGNGTLTQLFINHKTKEVTVSVIYTWVADVYRVKDNTITLSKLDNGPVKTSDEFETTGFAADDIVVYTFSRDNNTIQSVTAATKVEGEVTRVRSNTSSGGAEDTGDYYVVDGKQYNYNFTTDANDHLLAANVNSNAVTYLDNYGYCIYVDESAVSYNYAYVLSSSKETRYGEDTYEGQLLLTDGTIVRAEMELSAASKKDFTDAGTKDDDGKISPLLVNNHIVSYSKDKNGIYTLTDRSAKLSSSANLKVEKNVASVRTPGHGGNSYSANANTIFIVADPGNTNRYADWNFTVYQGIRNVPNIEGKSTTQVCVGTGSKASLADVVYIQNANVSGETSVIFVEANPTAKQLHNGEDGSYSYEIKAVEKGETKTLYVRSDSEAAVALVSNTQPAKKHVVAIKGYNTNSLGQVTSIREYDLYNTTDYDGVGTGISTDKTTRNTVGIGVVSPNGKLPTPGNPAGPDNKYAVEYFGYNDDAVVVEYDDGFTVLRGMNNVKSDDNDGVLFVLDGRALTGICVMKNKDDVAYGAGTQAVSPKPVEDVPPTVDTGADGKPTGTIKPEKPTVSKPSEGKVVSEVEVTADELTSAAKKDGTVTIEVPPASTASDKVNKVEVTLPTNTIRNSKDDATTGEKKITEVTIETEVADVTLPAEAITEATGEVTVVVETLPVPDTGVASDAKFVFDVSLVNEAGNTVPVSGLDNSVEITFKNVPKLTPTAEDEVNVYWVHTVDNTETATKLAPTEFAYDSTNDTLTITVDHLSTFAVKVEKSAPALDVTAATLNDTRTGADKADVLFDGNSYKVIATKTGTDYAVTVTATNLVKHQNTNSQMGAWVGAKVKVPAGYSFVSVTNSAGTTLTEGFLDEGTNDTVSFYLDASKKTEESFKNTRTIVIKDTENNQFTYVLTFNLDGVTVFDAAKTNAAAMVNSVMPVSGIAEPLGENTAKNVYAVTSDPKVLSITKAFSKVTDKDAEIGGSGLKLIGFWFGEEHLTNYDGVAFVGFNIPTLVNDNNKEVGIKSMKITLGDATAAGGNKYATVDEEGNPDTKALIGIQAKNGQDTPITIRYYSEASCPDANLVATETFTMKIAADAITVPTANPAA